MQTKLSSFKNVGWQVALDTQGKVLQGFCKTSNFQSRANSDKKSRLV